MLALVPVQLAGLVSWFGDKHVREDKILHVTWVCWATVSQLVAFFKTVTITLCKQHMPDLHPAVLALGLKLS